MNRNINKAETLAALVVVALGMGVIAVGSSYPVGSIDRMGPGYFPLLLGGALSLIGLGLVLEVMRSEPVKLRFPIRPFAAVTSGVLAFTARKHRSIRVLNQ